ncbi:hypothetical protein ACLB2K_054270 [Fragaria x ananassa]
MAEAHARNNQYQLRSNSGLVLTSDSRSRDTHAPSGEAESLRGRIDPNRFGDRAHTARPKRHRRDPTPEPALIYGSTKRCRFSEESVLTTMEEDGAVYRPKTKETRAAYEALLHLIWQRLGDQPASVVHGAADEVLAVVKGKSFDKRKEIENLLNSVGDDFFDQFVQIGKLITDYGGDDDVAGCDDVDFDVGFSVDFEEEEEDDNGVGMVVEEEDEEEEEQKELSVGGGAPMSVDGDDVMVECSEGGNVNVHDIDAYWVQRKIYEAYERKIEPQECQKLAEEVVGILGEGDAGDVESRLLEKLRFEKFGLVKFLLLNRVKIVWCTRLARAGGGDESNVLKGARR